MAGQTLEHTGAAIVEEYYPEYAETKAPVYPLYSDLVYIGSAVILLSMAMLGLPITALGYAIDPITEGVSMGLAIFAVVANVVVFLVGLGLCMAGFKRHKRPDDHH